jgi:EmrB/QacA subfamily drug resistance transporter
VVSLSNHERGSAVAFGAQVVAVFLGAVDQTVVVTALPAIISDLRIPFDRLNDAAWIVTAYLLGYTVGMPLVGRMSDVYGRGRVFSVCLVSLGLTSIACGASRRLEWLIAARGLQAVGGGALLPVALASVGDVFPRHRHSLMLGLVAATAEAGGVIGPLWGALILDHTTWPWVFFINVPLVVAILAVRTWFADPSPLDKTSPPGGRGGSVDYPGALLMGGGLGALALSLSRETSQGLLVRFSLAGLAAALLAGFVLWERRITRTPPLIELALFGRAPFAAGNALSLLSGVALIVAMVDVPLWSATVLQRSAVDGGLLLMRLMLAIPVGAVVGGLLTRHLGPRPVAMLGVLSSGAGLLLLAGWRPDTPALEMSAHLAVAGLGFGLQLAPLTAVVVRWAGAARAGIASALVTVMRMIGMLLGLSALTSWGLERFNSLVANLPLPLPVLGEAPELAQQRLAAYQQAILDASLTVFSEIFVVAAGVCGIALLPALLLRLPKD